MQERLSNTAPFQVKSAKVLRTEIFKCLNTAQDDGRLRTELSQIHKLLKEIPKTKGIIEITGGERNFKLDKAIPHFERIDGCWFDFAILVNENYKPAEIIGFNCEIIFLDNQSIKFLRFDFNLPEHRNEDRGMRFHLHPGSDDFMVPSPPMSPLEIINLFLYGLDIPPRPRSS